MSLQSRIIQLLSVKPFIDSEIEITKRIHFLKSYLRKHQFFKTLIVGISGGQDSTLTGALSQIAIHQLRKETKDNNYKFIAVRLPYGIQSDEQDCQHAIEFIQPDSSITVNIKDAVLQSVYSLEKAGLTISDILRGNEKARERMKIQYSIAGMNNGLVVGTHHAAEAITGYFTKYGDGGSDINPLFCLNKRQGRQLLKFLRCPKNLYLKDPTADLEDKRPGLKDELALGVTYEKIDDYLEGKIIDKRSAVIIENWYLKTEHKRHLPVTILDDFWKMHSITS